MDVIQATRDLIGLQPREFTLWARLSYLRVPMPYWAKKDTIGKCILAAPQLLTGGTVVWGHIVQANSNLFSVGNYDHPAAVLYSPDERYTPSPKLLGPIAAALFELKEAGSSDPEAGLIAEHLANEYSTPYGLPVPASITGSCPCLFSSIFIVRKHLPDKKLSLSYFPLLISDEHPGMTMIVPSRFWPEDFREEWVEAGRS